MEFNVHQAKTNLSKLILRAEAGEEVVIARAGKPVVKLVPLKAASTKLFKPGALKGRLRVPADFLEPDAEFDTQLEQLFYRSPILSTDIQSRPRRKGKSRKA
jgi:prevent-host-death family protein